MAWVPRLDIWFHAHRNRGTLPKELDGMTLRQAEKYLGMAHSARDAVVFRRLYNGGVEERFFRGGNRIVQRYATPLGETEAISRLTEDAERNEMLPIPTEFFLRQEKDYEIMRYVVEHTRYEPNYAAYAAYDADVGEDGLPMVPLGPCPFHLLLLAWAGYESFYYHLADWPEAVRGLLEALNKSYRQMWEVVAASPAKFLMHGEHFSGQLTPPPVFKKHFLPYFKEFNAVMHAAGKKVCFHADADLTGLLDLALECDFDAADCFACAPLVDTTFDEARRVWGERIVIWGGLPSLLLEDSFTFDEFREYVEELYAKTAGQPAFILAISDNIMPAARFDRLLWIRDFLEEQARSPSRTVR